MELLVEGQELYPRNGAAGVNRDRDLPLWKPSDVTQLHGVGARLRPKRRCETVIPL